MTKPNDFLGSIVSLDNIFDDNDNQGQPSIDKTDADDKSLDDLVVISTEIDNQGTDPDDKSKGDKPPVEPGAEPLKGIEPEVNKNKVVKETLSFLIESKLIDPIEKFIIDDEGTEVNYDEAEVTPETLSQLIADKIEEVRQATIEEQEKHVSDFTKHLIKIEKNGGDVAKALETYGRLVNPLQFINLEQEEDQIKVIELELKNKNISDSVIRATIKGFKADGILETEAAKSLQTLEDSAKEELDKQVKEAEAQRAKDKQFVDNYRKVLKTKLDEFKLPDNLSKSFVDSATKKLENSSYAVDSKYAELRRDPEQAAELIMFLMNKEAYLKMKMEQALIDSKIDVAKTIRVIKRNSSSPVIRSKDSKSNDLVPLNEFS